MNEDNKKVVGTMPVVNIMMPPKVENEEKVIDNHELIDDLKIGEDKSKNAEMGNLINNTVNNAVASNVNNNLNNAGGATNNIPQSTEVVDTNNSVENQILNNSVSMNNDVNVSTQIVNSSVDDNGSNIDNNNITNVEANNIVPKPINVENIVYNQESQNMVDTVSNNSSNDENDMNKTMVIPVIPNTELKEEEVKDNKNKKSKMPLVGLLIVLIILGISIGGFVLLNKNDKNNDYYLDEIKGFVSKTFVFNNKYDNEKINFNIFLGKSNDSSLDEDTINSISKIKFNGDLFFSKDEGFKLLNLNLLDESEMLGIVNIKDKDEEVYLSVDNLFEDTIVVKGISKNLFGILNISLHRDKILEYLDNMGVSIVSDKLDDKDVSLVNLNINSDMLSNLGINYKKDIKVNFYFEGEKLIRTKMFVDVYCLDIDNSSSNNNFSVYKNNSLIYSGFVIRNDENVVMSISNKHNNNLVFIVNYTVDTFDSVEDIIATSKIIIDKSEYEGILNKFSENFDFNNFYNYLKNVFYMVK